MKVIAAVVVGGVAITGGRGTIAGTMLGLILLGVIGPALTFLGFSAYWERAIQGGIILAAVAIDAVRVRSRRLCSHRCRSASIGRGASAGSPTANGCCCWPWPWSSRIFAAIGENFFTLANFFEVVRLSVELGLLALA